MAFNSQEKNVKALAGERKFDEALAESELLLERFPEKKADVLRLRAYIYSLQGVYDKAISEREALIDGGYGILRDYYQLGDNSLSLGRFADASRWLNQALDLGEQQNETWFRGAALFLLAYAKLQMGELKDAATYLDQAVAIDPDCALPIADLGMVKHEVLRDEITRRINGEKRGHS